MRQISADHLDLLKQSNLHFPLVINAIKRRVGSRLAEDWSLWPDLFQTVLSADASMASTMTLASGRARVSPFVTHFSCFISFFWSQLILLTL